MSRVLPPVIRLFISSTFADMTRERQYFNTVIEPKLSRMCAERGVSFFSVDLRWGITEEDQMSGNVLPICLQEIDNCRPFFIGILGKRYGSVLQDVTDATKDSFPWLDGHLDKSVTELEMYYGVLRQERNQKETTSLFLFREDALSDQFYQEKEDEEKQDKLRILKDSIRKNETIKSADYDSLESFETEIIEAVKGWLDREFPTGESVHEAKKNWYNNELLRDYVSSDKVLAFLDNYGQNSSRSLMISGSGLSGKTTVLTDWMPKNGEKILVNIGADSDYLYWPYIAHDIIKRIHEIDEAVGYPKMDTPASFFFFMKEGLRRGKEEDNSKESSELRFYVTDGDRESFREGFVSWLKNIKPSVPVYVVINDLNLLSEAEAPYLKWLPAETEGAVHIVCSANDGTIVDNAKILGWNVKEMLLFPKEDTEVLLDRYMGIFGKNLSVSQRNHLLQTPLLSYPGYLKYIIRYLNKYGSFDNLDDLCEKIGQIDTADVLYGFVLDKLLDEMTVKESQAAKVALYILAVTMLGITEDELWGLVKEIEPIDPIGWARIHIVFEQFQLVTADAWKIWDGTLCRLVQDFDVPVEKIHTMLGQYFFSKMDEEIAFSMTTIKNNTDLSKAVLYHLAKAKEWAKLSEKLSNWNILYYLSKLEWRSVRSAWVQIFLYSDIDVPKMIFDLLGEFHNKTLAPIEGILERLAWLLYDMEFFEYAKKAESVYEVRKGSEIRSLDMRRFSKEMLDAYERFSNITKFQHMPMLLKMISDFLVQNEDKLNAYEKTQFYMIKSSAELKIRDLENGIKTSYKYYESAIDCMNDMELLRALMNRAQLVYFAGNYEEAKSTLDYCYKLALDIGGLREFLAINNMRGMIGYRIGEFNLALERFDLCMHAWEKLGNKREVISIWLNKGNCLTLKGDTDEAIKSNEDLKAFIEKLPGREYQIQYSQVLGNLGLLYAEAGEIEKAETYLLKQLKLAEEIGVTRERDFQAIIEFYNKNQLPTKAIEMMKKFLEFLFAHEQYDQMEPWIDRCTDLMEVQGYRHEMEPFRNMWKERISKAKSGDNNQSGADRNAFDPLAEARLREALVVARSEKDEAKAGEILSRLAFEVLKKDKREAADLFMQSMISYGNVGQVEDSFEAACQAICLLVELYDKQTYEKNILAFIKDEEHLMNESLDNCGIAIIDEWFALQVSEDDAASYREDIEKILELLGASASKSTAEIGSLCFMGEAEKLFDRLPEETVLSVAHWMKGQNPTTFKTFSQKAFAPISQSFANNHKELIGAYVGARADELLALYERGIHYAVALENVDAGALAGNIAIIYRRRGEKEKTFELHKLAIEVYEKHGLLRDMYIEKMNLCTAYHDLESPQKAVEGLRAILKESELEKIKDLQAAVAGNLAAYLREVSDTSNDSEIMECFKIEESYYEKAGELRELVISLANQIQFHLMRHILPPEEILGMYMKAEKIVTSMNLREFMGPLSRIKILVMAAQNAESNNTSNRHNNNGLVENASKPENNDRASKVSMINRAREKLFGTKRTKDQIQASAEEIPGNQGIEKYSAGDLINELLEANDYEIMQIVDMKDEQHMEVVCKKKKQVPLVVDNLKLTIDTSNLINIKYQFSMLPFPPAGPITENLRKYVMWWNMQSEYQLHLVQDTQGRDVIVIQENFQAKTLEEVNSVFGRVVKLWDADLLNVSLASLTRQPMDDLMAAKLEILNQ